MINKLHAYWKHFEQLRFFGKWLQNVNWEECNRPRYQVALDLLYIYFVLRTLPTHYGPCRLWEVPKSQWHLYYGTSYSPLAYFRLSKEVQPVKFEVLYRDKVINALLCQSLGLPQPRLLGIIDPSQDFQSIIADHLKSTPDCTAIIKPALGRGGQGIVLAKLIEKRVMLHRAEDNSEVDLSSFKLAEKSLIQGLVKQHKDMAAVAASSVNTARVVTFLTRSNDILFVKCVARFSSGTSFVDNWCAGGISVPINLETGRLGSLGRDKHARNYEAHPVSGVVFGTFTLPVWERIKELAIRTHRTLPYFKLIGHDICIDDSGEPALIEINPYPDLLEQNSGPLFA